MARPTKPILREEILFRDETPREEMLYQYNSLKEKATKQVTAIHREDTLTINVWEIERFQPKKFQWTESPSGEKSRHIVGNLAEGFWYRNRTTRYVLSFRGEYPRLYLMKGKSIREISYSLDAWLPHGSLKPLAKEIRRRYPETKGLAFPEAFVVARTQYGKDLLQHGIKSRSHFVEFSRGTKRGSRNWGIKEVSDYILGEYSTRATRRALLELIKDENGDWSILSRRVYGLSSVGEFFDASVWPEILTNLKIGLAKNRRGEHIFENLSPARRLRLVRELYGEWYDWNAHDSAQMYDPDVDISGCRNWQEIHDRLDEAARIRRRQEEHELDEYLREGIVDQSHYNGIDGVKVGEFEILTPKKPYDLEDWGDTLDHCIGAYARSTKDGESLLFALATEGEVIYTGMIRGGYLNQFRGYKNEVVPEEIFAATVEVLKEHKLIVPDHKNAESYNSIF